ncbi:hypothetical protein, conserved [Eimeria brunetti]|uniref:TLC domain-containing protein n=1 Tax=Eimeria brunetti TaxID=51314 RepID=U6LLD8_9EIME|nr:hypothetical protein, conserved [Eimeria brunetti]
MLLYSLSFFLYDLLYVLVERDIPTTLHHIGAVAAITCSFSQGTAGAELVAGLTVGECSTPLLHLRYFARHFAAVTAAEPQTDPSETEGWDSKAEGGADKAEGKDHGSKAGDPRVAELGFVFVFIFARAVGGTALTAATCRCSTTPLAVKAMATLILQLINAHSGKDQKKAKASFAQLQQKQHRLRHWRLQRQLQLQFDHRQHLAAIPGTVTTAVGAAAVAAEAAAAAAEASAGAGEAAVPAAEAGAELSECSPMMRLADRLPRELRAHRRKGEGAETQKRGRRRQREGEHKDGEQEGKTEKARGTEYRK